MPITSSPRSATGTSRAVVRLAVGDAQAGCWNLPRVSKPAYPGQQRGPYSWIGCIHVRQERGHCGIRV
eukprot:4060946-Prorocentrum_lima.AAC.1